MNEFMETAARCYEAGKADAERIWRERFNNQDLMLKDMIRRHEELIKMIADARVFLPPEPIYICAICGKDRQ